MAPSFGNLNARKRGGAPPSAPRGPSLSHNPPPLSPHPVRLGDKPLFGPGSRKTGANEHAQPPRDQTGEKTGSLVKDVPMKIVDTADGSDDDDSDDEVAAVLLGRTPSVRQQRMVYSGRERTLEGEVKAAISNNSEPGRTSMGTTELRQVTPTSASLMDRLDREGTGKATSARPPDAPQAQIANRIASTGPTPFQARLGPPPNIAVKESRTDKDREVSGPDRTEKVSHQFSPYSGPPSRAELRKADTNDTHTAGGLLGRINPGQPVPNSLLGRLDGLQQPRKPTLSDNTQDPENTGIPSGPAGLSREKADQALRPFDSTARGQPTGLAVSAPPYPVGKASSPLRAVPPHPTRPLFERMGRPAERGFSRSPPRRPDCVRPRSPRRWSPSEEDHRPRRSTIYDEPESYGRERRRSISPRRRGPPGAGYWELRRSPPTRPRSPPRRRFRDDDRDAGRRSSSPSPRLTTSLGRRVSSTANPSESVSPCVKATAATVRPTESSSRPIRVSLLVSGLPRLPISPRELYDYIHDNISGPKTKAPATSLALAKLPGGKLTAELIFDRQADARAFAEVAPKEWKTSWRSQGGERTIHYVIVDRDKAFWPANRQVYRPQGSSLIEPAKAPSLMDRVAKSPNADGAVASSGVPNSSGVLQSQPGKPDSNSQAASSTALQHSSGPGPASTPANIVSAPTSLLNKVLLSNIPNSYSLAGLEYRFQNPQRPSHFRAFQPVRITSGRLRGRQLDLEPGCLVEFASPQDASGFLRAVERFLDIKGVVVELSDANDSIFLSADGVLQPETPHAMVGSDDERLTSRDPVRKADVQPPNAKGVMSLSERVAAPALSPQALPFQPAPAAQRDSPASGRLSARITDADCFEPTSAPDQQLQKLKQQLLKQRLMARRADLPSV